MSIEQKQNGINSMESRSTRQRKLLLDLLQEGKHLTINELFYRAKDSDSHISLSTVYRNLRYFLDAGLVNEILVARDKPRYFEAIRQDKHHHIFCLKCGRIMDFDSPIIESLKKSVEEETGMVMKDIILNMTGYCDDCSKQTVE